MITSKDNMVENRVPKSVFRSKLQYDESTGNLVWIGKSRNSGKIAGKIHKGTKTEYKSVGIGYLGKIHQVMTHRIVLMLTTGDWPIDDIDHIDGNGLNNLKSNLRCVTRTVNNENQCRQSNNTSGLTGVSWTERLKKWRVYSSETNPRRQIHLGVYSDFFEACCARKTFELTRNFTERHGKDRV